MCWCSDIVTQAFHMFMINETLPYVLEKEPSFAGEKNL
jgi:hypothetical protein